MSISLYLVQISLILKLLEASPIPNDSKEHYSYTPPTSEDDFFAVLVVLMVMMGMLAFLLAGVGAFFLVRYLMNRNKSVRLDHSEPGSLDDEFEIEERLAELSPNEQNLYRSGQEFIKTNPPIDEQLTLSNHLLIQEKGIEAWEFIPDLNLENNAIDINNKTELSFNNYDYQCSIQTNLPIPKINDVYYFEAKLYNYDPDSIVSIGLSTKPYPYFRLPGRHLYSVAYDSNGSRRVNNSFRLNEAESTVFPVLQKGDVVGIGYRVRSGTIFFTRNGKKLSEKSIGGHIKGMKMPNLFPIIGANNPCTIHINLGQYGYVFIEANVKKWGYASKDGNRPPLPEYGYSSNDLLLESSNEDDEEEIINPPDFYENAGYNSNNSSFINDNITLNTLPAEPPTYTELRTSDKDTHDNTINNQFLDNDSVEEYEANITASIIREDTDELENR